MMNLHLYLFELLAVTSATITTPLVFLNTSEVAATLVSPASLGTPDRRFRVQVNFDGPKFPLISCLMNTVGFLEYLGNQDFLGSTEEVSWKSQKYPEVGMTISPSAENERIERRVAIWGLSQGIAHMIHQLRFETATFTLYCMCPLQSFFSTQASLKATGQA